MKGIGTPERFCTPVVRLIIMPRLSRPYGTYSAGRFPGVETPGYFHAVSMGLAIRLDLSRRWKWRATFRPPDGTWKGVPPGLGSAGLRDFTSADLGGLSREVSRDRYLIFAYSAFACFKIGTSGSASFQSAKKS
jgi:hypothetical protein